jgi:hypothetical protein
MQLEFNLGNPSGSAATSLYITRPLRKHRRCNTIIERVQYTRRFFPELEGIHLKVGLTRAASGMAIMGGNEIWLNPSQSSYHTIAHEFVHLLQTREEGIPQGEKSCDVFSMARHWTLNDVPPNYVRIPTQLWSLRGTLTEQGSRVLYDVALEALTRRKNGLRRYIAWFEARLAEMVR